MRERLIKKKYYFSIFSFFFLIHRKQVAQGIYIISSLESSHRGQSIDQIIYLCYRYSSLTMMIAMWDGWTLKKCFFEIIIFKILIIIINQYIIKYYNFIIYIYVLNIYPYDIGKTKKWQSQAIF